MIRLIASDMDGTLLNSRGRLSERTVREIKKIQEKGVVFAICTGRIFNLARQELERNGIQCSYLCNSGAQIIDEKGQIIRSIPLDQETAGWVISMFEKWKVPMDIQTENQFFMVCTWRDMVRKAFYFWRQGRLLHFIKKNFHQSIFDKSVSHCRWHERLYHFCIQNEYRNKLRIL